MFFYFHYQCTLIPEIKALSSKHRNKTYEGFRDTIWEKMGKETRKYFRVTHSRAHMSISEGPFTWP